MRGPDRETLAIGDLLGGGGQVRPRPAEQVRRLENLCVVMTIFRRVLRRAPIGPVLAAASAEDCCVRQQDGGRVIAPIDMLGGELRPLASCVIPQLGLMDWRTMGQIVEPVALA